VHLQVPHLEQRRAGPPRVRGPYPARPGAITGVLAANLLFELLSVVALAR